jgi:DNA-binding SARP family transcriptional activator
VEFRILGPLDVVEDGAPVALGAHKQRAVLAMLLLDRGEAVSVDRLSDGLWDERPPARAAKSIQVYVSQLRKALGPDVLQTRGRGYALSIEPESLDSVRFERMLDRGRELAASGEPRRAKQVLQEALELWRGPALADFAYEHFAQAEIARLEDLKVATIEERVDADLALGRYAQLVPELESLVCQHPLRERLRGQLMLALYGSGRQAEALDAYAAARQTLVDQLGIEPGPALRELQARILAQDRDLAPPATPAALVRRRRGGRLILAGGLALVAAAAAAMLVALGDDDAPALGAVRPLPSSFCSPLQFQAGSRPQLLVVSDQELQGPEAQLGNEIAGAVEYVLRQSRFRAGRYALAYQACDDATETEGGSASAKCARNAEEYAANPSVIAVIGPTLSTCAVVQLPITNRARGGPVPMVSPSNTRVGLTRGGLGAEPGEPGRYYPTGERSYVRLLPADDFEVAADAILAKRLGLRKVFVAAESGSSAIADAFRTVGRKLGLSIAGAVAWNADDPDSYPQLARKARRSGADGVFLAGPISAGGVDLLRALRAELPAHVALLATGGFSLPDPLRDAGRAAEGLRVTVAGVAPAALRGRGKQVVAGLERALEQAPGQFSVYAAQATELLLDAIARSDGTRRSLIRALFASSIHNGLLGDFAVTQSGDITSNHVTVYRVTGGRLRLDRVIEPPLNLVVRH